jgi:hypothetical protein
MKYTYRLEEAYHEESKTVYFKVPTKRRQDYSYYKGRKCFMGGIRYCVRLTKKKYEVELSLLINFNSVTLL